MTTVKQVIVLRKDLNMRKGKMVAQGAHASLAVITNLLESRSIPFESNGSDFDGLGEDGLFLSSDNFNFKQLKQWLDTHWTKICVSVNSEQELLDIYKQAQDAGVLCSLIKDSGFTEFNGVATYTAVAVGPDFPEVIDQITGKLPLL